MTYTEEDIKGMSDGEIEFVNVGHSCGTGEKIVLVTGNHRAISKACDHHWQGLKEPILEPKNREPWYVQHDKKKRKKK